MNREEAIREARTIEAMKKGYSGLGGKIATIAKILGESIVEQQGGMLLQSGFLEDPYAADSQEEGDMPVFDEEERAYEVGVIFDGLRYGINLSIILRHYQREIVCEFNGHKVFWEVAGELEAFVPDDAWEKRLNEIYVQAVERERLRRPAQKEKLIKEANRRKQEILEDFRKKWGLS
jgi:hypothetical protein